MKPADTPGLNKCNHQSKFWIKYLALYDEYREEVEKQNLVPERYKKHKIRIGMIPGILIDKYFTQRYLMTFNFYLNGHVVKDVTLVPDTNSKLGEKILEIQVNEPYNYTTALYQLLPKCLVIKKDSYEFRKCDDTHQNKEASKIYLGQIQ